MCEEYDLNHYEPNVGTGDLNQEYEGKPWGITGQDDSDTAREIGFGKDNTDYLIGRYASNTYLWYYVNQHRMNTGKDWCVPSMDELDILYENNVIIGNFSVSGSHDYYYKYWSSFEFTSDIVWVQYFASGSQTNNNLKSSTNGRVRCIRYV